MEGEYHLPICISIFKLVPVLWPSAGKEFLAYFTDRVWSKAAGEALRQSTMIPVTETFSKSVLCHSMGNHLLKYVANEANSLFDNIFMVASDENSVLFNKKLNIFCSMQK